jgi:uncharacterized protein YoxC
MTDIRKDYPEHAAIGERTPTPQEIETARAMQAMIAAVVKPLMEKYNELHSDVKRLHDRVTNVNQMIETNSDEIADLDDALRTLTKNQMATDKGLTATDTRADNIINEAMKLGIRVHALELKAIAQGELRVPPGVVFVADGNKPEDASGVKSDMSGRPKWNEIMRNAQDLVLNDASNPLVIVRFDCGCVGTKPDAKGNSAIIMACDNTDGRNVGGRERPMFDKKYEPVDADYAGVIWRAFADQDEYRQVQSALRMVVRDE